MLLTHPLEFMTLGQLKAHIAPKVFAKPALQNEGRQIITYYQGLA